MKSYWNSVAQWLILIRLKQAEVKECYKLIQELAGSNCNEKHGHKRKHSWIPCSPSGVVDASFSSDSSNDLWGVTVIQSVSSSLEPRLKRSRAPDQQMRLPPLNRMFVDVLSTPH